MAGRTAKKLLETLKLYPFAELLVEETPIPKNCLQFFVLEMNLSHVSLK